MGTTTTNLGLYKPAVNDPVDADNWSYNDAFDTLDSEAAIWTLSKNAADFTLSRVMLKDYGEVAATGQTATGLVTINISSTGNHYQGTLTGNTTFTFSNPAPTGNFCALVVTLTQDGTGGRTVSWPASVVWAGGVTPTMTTAASKTDIFSFVTYNAGAKWYGSVVNQNYS